MTSLQVGAWKHQEKKCRAASAVVVHHLQRPDRLEITFTSVMLQLQYKIKSRSSLPPSWHFFSLRSSLLSCKSCTFLKVKHTSFGGFPSILVHFPEVFERSFFHQNRSQDRQITRKHWATAKTLKRRKHRTTEWAPELLCHSHDLESWSSYCCPFSWQHCGWKCKSG